MKNLKIIDFESLSTIKQSGAGKKIVHCHGVFDLLHYGHLAHLHSAKKLGDLLVVTITPDRFVNKGPDRPRFNETIRSQMLAALEIVDYVAINRSGSGVDVINQIHPDFYVKGPDYSDKSSDITAEIYKEEQAVTNHGGKLIFTGDPTESASTLINEFFTEWDSEQEQTLKTLKDNIGLESIIRTINSFESLKILVVGEPIVDTYVFCQPENLSSKSPSISANFISEENYAGGTWAVARHLAALGCQVSLIAPCGTDPITSSCLQDMLLPNLHIVSEPQINFVTPRKTRFISPFMNQRMFELTQLDTANVAGANLDNFIRDFSDEINQADLVIALDFGHGLWEGPRSEVLSCAHKFVALNVQTNSGNYGYNLFHKHKHYDFLVLDERELRLGMHNRFSLVEPLALELKESIQDAQISVTLGSRGSLFIDSNSNQWTAPTYFRDPVDTTGAGDAYFAITSLLAYNQADPLLIPFIGNLFAGLKTRIIGNKTSVKKVDLIRAITALLK